MSCRSEVCPDTETDRLAQQTDRSTWTTEVVDEDDDDDGCVAVLSGTAAGVVSR